MSNNLPIKLQLPEGFLEEENREGYVVTAAQKAVWAVALDLLAEFQRVCNEAGLKWWISDGTTLGAVRHKGFIPWDDDIDVMMMREDFERMCQLAPQAFEHPYFWQTEATDPWSGRHHAQLRNSLTTGILSTERARKFPFNQGIFIDIFPLDHIPEDQEVATQWRARLIMLAAQQRSIRARTFFSRRKSFIKTIHNYVVHILKYRTPAKVYPKYKRLDDDFEALITKYNDEPCTLLSELPNLKRSFPISDFSSTVMMPFEMLQVPVPTGYENQMVIKYGKDWRTPIQMSNAHGNVVFDPYKPYNE